eukprot:TRINITY_DN7132_c0_g1_i1.p1 TRINITY_DN7132_c0_g1~~TRINITY_DN7132_c0_g1_i1.p1  ORF type:complete len:201 (-),score=9.49 TRINITY_DN7132_c0_g1_i1:506-1108(-)
MYGAFETTPHGWFEADSSALAATSKLAPAYQAGVPEFTTHSTNISLPNEIGALIFSFLTGPELITASQVCSGWRSLILSTHGYTARVYLCSTYRLHTIKHTGTRNKNFETAFRWTSSKLHSQVCTFGLFIGLAMLPYWLDDWNSDPHWPILVPFTIPVVIVSIQFIVIQLLLIYYRQMNQQQTADHDILLVGPARYSILA